MSDPWAADDLSVWLSRQYPAITWAKGPYTGVRLQFRELPPCETCGHVEIKADVLERLALDERTGEWTTVEAAV